MKLVSVGRERLCGETLTFKTGFGDGCGLAHFYRDWAVNGLREDYWIRGFAFDCHELELVLAPNSPRRDLAEFRDEVRRFADHLSFGRPVQRVATPVYNRVVFTRFLPEGEGWRYGTRNEIGGDLARTCHGISVVDLIDEWGDHKPGTAQHSLSSFHGTAFHCLLKDGVDTWEFAEKIADRFPRGRIFTQRGDEIELLDRVA